MATPKHQQIYTPKNHLTTPIKPNVTSSPRPQVNSFGQKTLTGTLQPAGKTPAIKTLSVLHNNGYTHRVSVSSAPNGTPLALSTLPDDILNMNTPVTNALMGMGQTGLTPLPNAQDGFGTANGGMMDNLDSIRTKNGTNEPRDPQAERQTRLRQVATILKKKASGRGVNRKSLQTLAKIHRFNIQYEEADDFLNIAGDNIVDLGITFGGLGTDRENVVEAATLELIGSDGDGVKQPEKAQVLYGNLTDAKGLPWVELNDFSANLEYLARFEELGIKSNAFKAVDSLYDVFQKIWSEEKERMKWRNTAQHLCEGSVGMPCSDQHGKLGVQTRYWTDGRRRQSKHDDEPNDRTEDSKNWNLTFAIERSSEGAPCIAANRDFLSDEVLVNMATSENVFRETVDKPAWQNHSTDGLGLTLDAAAPTQIRYVATLEPPINLPAQAITALNQVHPAIMVDTLSTRTLHEVISTNSNSYDRWTKPQIVFDKPGVAKDVSHSYAIYPDNNRDIFCYPIERFSFSHPKYLAEAIPVFRQYALVDTLLHSMTPLPSQSQSHAEAFSEPTDHASTQQENPVMPDRTKVQRRSNKPQTALELDTLMSNSPLQPTKSANPTAMPTKSASRNIDITFSVLSASSQTAPSPSSPSPTVVRIDVLVSSLLKPGFVNFSIDIRPNGIISVDGLDVDVEFETDGKNEQQQQQWKEKLTKKLARALRVSEDLGVAVEYLMREIEAKG